MRQPGRTSRLTLIGSITTTLALLIGGQPALAENTPTTVVVADGRTQPVFGYADAIRERVWVQAGFDSDANGVPDEIALDVIRPRATEQGLKVPVVMDASPYYSTLGRGNESELKADQDGDGLLDRWPLFYDNYFVPRGYAVVLLDMVGTNNSTGCPTTNGTPDNLSAKTAIDWLNGRATARDAAGEAVTVDWHNGRTGMIGKSYDGSLAMATAVTGVAGLTTVVPIAGPANYYDYTRSNGVRTRGPDYPASLANTVTNPERRSHCAPVRAALSAADGDESADYSPFWDERNYVKDVDKIRASVFLVHGINDDNVRPDHFSKFWAALAEHRVPRKLWISQEGHVDPFDFRRAEWVDTLHRWFDYWLQGVHNGITDEPVADVERSADAWQTYADWPVPGSTPTSLWLRPGAADGAGRFALTPGGQGRATQSFQDNPTQTEAAMVANPTVRQPGRLAFLSAPLTQPLHVSGTPVVRLNAAANQTDTNFGAILVDYGPATRVAHRQAGEGIRTLTTEDCWGERSTTDDACYRQTAKQVVTADQEIVTKGILDALNRDSLTAASPLVPGRSYEFTYPLLPEDYVFPAGHRIGLIIVGSYPQYSSLADQTKATVTLAMPASRIELPIVGGRAAAAAAGL